MLTYIARCHNCKPHTFQDQWYGMYMRVINKSTKSIPGIEVGNCTVCGALTKKGTATDKK